MTYPFRLWDQPIELIECAVLGGVTSVVTAGGPLGKEARVFDATNGTVRAEYSIGTWMADVTSRPHRVARRSDGEVLAVAIDHRRKPVVGLGEYFVRLLDPLTGASAGPGVASPGEVVGVHAYPDDDRDVLVVVEEGGTFSQFDVDTCLPRRDPIRGHGPVTSSAVAATGTGQALGVAAAEPGTLTLWDLRTRDRLWTEGDNGLPVRAVAISPGRDRTYLAVAREPRHVEVRDALTGSRVAEPFGLRLARPQLAFGEVGGRLTLYVANGYAVHVLDAATVQPLRPPWVRPDEINALQFAVVGGRSVLFVADDASISMLDSETGDVLVGRTGP